MPDRVLVLGDDVRSFLAVARSLGRRGLEVHAAPPDLASPALASRYIAAFHILPSYALGPEAWETALLRLIVGHDVRLIIPCGDSSLMRLAHHADALGRERVALPNPEALVAFGNKLRTRALAARLGVPLAGGRELGPADRADALAEHYGLPLLLKPVASHVVGDARDKREVRLIRSAEALKRALAAGAWQNCYVERFFAGQGVGVSVLADKGHIIQAYQHRRLRQSTATGASTSRVSEAVDPALLAHIEALAGAVALDGVAMFEFRRDPRTGRHVLLEVNPRFWGSLPLALAAGADFPAMLLDLRRGVAPHVRPYRAGIVKRDLEGEYERRVRCADDARSLPAKLGWSALALLTPLLVRRRTTDSWAPDDPAPFVAERRLLFARIAKAMAKRLFSRRRPVSAIGLAGKPDAA